MAIRLSREIRILNGEGPWVIEAPVGVTTCVVSVEMGLWFVRPGDAQQRWWSADGADMTITNGESWEGVEGPFLLTTTGELPGGLDATATYWARSESGSTFRLYTTYEGATQRDQSVTATSAGTGVHVIGGFGLGHYVPGTHSDSGGAWTQLPAGKAIHEIFMEESCKMTLRGTSNGRVSYWWLR